MATAAGVSAGVTRATLREDRRTLFSSVFPSAFSSVFSPAEVPADSASVGAAASVKSTSPSSLCGASSSSADVGHTRCRDIRVNQCEGKQQRQSGVKRTCFLDDRLRMRSHQRGRERHCRGCGLWRWWRHGCLPAVVSIVRKRAWHRNHAIWGGQSVLVRSDEGSQDVSKRERGKVQLRCRRCNAVLMHPSLLR